MSDNFDRAGRAPSADSGAGDNGGGPGFPDFGQDDPRGHGNGPRAAPFGPDVMRQFAVIMGNVMGQQVTAAFNAHVQPQLQATNARTDVLANDVGALRTEVRELRGLFNAGNNNANNNNRARTRGRPQAAAATAAAAQAPRDREAAAAVVRGLTLGNLPRDPAALAATLAVAAAALWQWALHTYALLLGPAAPTSLVELAALGAHYLGLGRNCGTTVMILPGGLVRGAYMVGLVLYRRDCCLIVAQVVLVATVNSLPAAWLDPAAGIAYSCGVRYRIDGGADGTAHGDIHFLGDRSLYAIPRNSTALNLSGQEQAFIDQLVNTFMADLAAAAAAAAAQGQQQQQQQQRPGPGGPRGGHCG